MITTKQIIILAAITCSTAIALNLKKLSKERITIDNSQLFTSIRISPSYELHPNQQNLDFAMDIFSIDKPDHVEGPILNHQIRDRGLTFGSGLGTKRRVEIGRPAFMSWGVLGSTLGHEIEIHCKQSFLIIWLSELLQLSGTVYAEREAYEYEEQMAERFGLSESEKAQIRYT